MEVGSSPANLPSESLGVQNGSVPGVRKDITANGYLSVTLRAAGVEDRSGPTSRADPLDETKTTQQKVALEDSE